MSAINDGGPAFPAEQHETTDGSWNQTFQTGMSLRDYCAIEVFARIASNPDVGASHEECAREALQAADAYLLERSKQR